MAIIYDIRQVSANYQEDKSNRIYEMTIDCFDLSFRRPNNVKPRKRDNSIMQNRVRIKYVRDKYNIIKIKTFTVSFMSDSAKKSWICKWMNLKLSTKSTFAENIQKMVAP